VADVQSLPFVEGMFDAVLSESVTSFPADKALAVREYARVVKKGGYVGMGEATWLKTPPPPELLAWVRQDVGATVEPLTAEAWVGLLREAGLPLVARHVREVQPAQEARGLTKRYGRAALVRSILRAARLYVRSPEYRAFVRSVREGGVLPAGLQEYFGYGLYVGRKE